MLLHPVRRLWLHRVGEYQIVGLPPIQDRLHDLRLQQRQPQDPRHVGRVDFFGTGEFVDRGVTPGLQQSPPPERPGPRLGQLGMRGL